MRFGGPVLIHAGSHARPYDTQGSSRPVAQNHVGRVGPHHSGRRVQVAEAASVMAEHMEAWRWYGQVARVIEALSAHARRLGEPQPADPPQHPRRVLSQNVGYLTRHQDHMRYPAYRASGWPIGSGETEAAVKQFKACEGDGTVLAGG